MALVKVKVLTEVLNESGRKKIETIQSENYEEPTDEYGRTAFWYEENSLRVPPELKEITKKGENISMEDEDYDYIYNIGYFKSEDFQAVVDNEDVGSTIYTESVVLRVLETARQIKNLIEKSYKVLG